MPVLKQFNFPDVGEGLTEGEILKWLVQPGDTVSDGQLIVEVETAKAAVELPCPFDGVVTALNAPEGATVDVGAPILTVDIGDAVDIGPDLTSDLIPEKPAAPAEPEKHAVLVGSGVKPGRTVRRARRSEPAAAAAPTTTSTTSLAEPAPANGVVHPAVLAKPPVRKLAKDRGVDLASLIGTGPQGTVTRADIDAAGAAPVRPVGGEQRIPVKGVRKQIAQAMVASAFTAPHVTEFLAIDITPTMQLRDRIAASREFAGVKVSPLLLVAKALLLAVRRNPMVNSSWDEERQEILVKDYVNLGIAAATERGLIVPNIKDADRMSLRELADAMAALTETARAGKTQPAELSRGTISITNVGVFGVDSGTPILPPGESAILAFGAVREMPWVVDGQVVPRQVTQLAVSFDHRIIDGKLGSEFLADIGAVLSDPGMALALG
ncbi:MAG TPA: dihydrolipoamide acetyltransferase family protein [Mycobacteriales bacterium]|nr:dihydrolipoamide acetyltransferase family protein [Mycobacteriales bacterium]